MKPLCALFIAVSIGAGALVGIDVARAAQDGAAVADKPIAAQGNWQCAFLKSKNAVEKSYYSWWVFEPGPRKLVVYYSPVHKGFAYGYRWSDKALLLDELEDETHQRVLSFEASVQSGGVLVIEDPRLSWGGWRCRQRAAVTWPADSVKFLDYGLYPWLKGLAEDAMEIMKYRHPQQYRQWLEDSKTRP